MKKILKPVYLVGQYGELGFLPDGSIINIGGVEGPDFSVGGKPLIFADGTATDGSGPVNFGITLQSAYDKSEPPVIKLVDGKNLVFSSENSNTFSIDGKTGKVIISGDLEVQGALISNLEFSAIDISIDTENLTFVSGDNVQDAINSIDNALKNIGQIDSLVKAYEHVQDNASSSWIIPHQKNSRRVQISIWDLDNELLFSDMVKIVDENTVVITFSTPVVGRAVLMLF